MTEYGCKHSKESFIHCISIHQHGVCQDFHINKGIMDYTLRKSGLIVP